MIKKIILIWFIAILSIKPVHAEEISQQQKKDFYYIQTLSKQIETIFQCNTNFFEDLTAEQESTLWKKYNNNVDELVREVEIFVERYPNKNPMSNNIYRMWQMIFLQKNDVKEPNKMQCLAYTIDE